MFLSAELFDGESCCVCFLPLKIQFHAGILGALPTSFLLIVGSDSGH